MSTEKFATYLCWSMPCMTSPPAASGCAFLDRPRRSDRHDDGGRQARLRHLRRARRIRARAHHRAYASRTRLRPRAWTRRRPQAQDDGGEVAARDGEHGQARDERRSAMRRARDYAADALSACRARRNAEVGRPKSARQLIVGMEAPLLTARDKNQDFGGCPSLASERRGGLSREISTVATRLRVRPRR